MDNTVYEEKSYDQVRKIAEQSAIAVKVVIGPQHEELLACACSCWLSAEDSGYSGWNCLSRFIYVAVEHYVPTARYNGDKCLFIGTVAEFRQLLHEAMVRVGPVTIVGSAWENNWQVV